MNLEELKDALRAADPSVVLVTSRVLGRVLQQVYHLPSQFLLVPHRKSLVLDRQLLFRYVEQDELELASDRLLPENVILLLKPTPEELRLWSHDSTLLRYWRLLFHARIHLALNQRIAAGRLTDSDIRSRLEQIGSTEYNEIRAVLSQENFVPRTADEKTIYCEFAALYLELKYFFSNLRSLYFPAIGDFARIDALLAMDVDSEELFGETRLAGAPEPVIRSDDSSDEPEDYYWQLVHVARRAAKAGNTVRAAILRTKAVRVAPVDLAVQAKAEALADMRALTERMEAALKLTEAETAEWLHVLPALLDKADQGHWTIEARLLYDLQNVCVDHEKDIFALDLVEWAASAGRRPMKRALPGQRLVRVAKQLRSAAQRLPMTRLTDQDRRRLANLLQAGQHRCEERLRARFRPILTDALADAGLNAENVPERTARNKLIEELLDRITEKGFLTFSDLRDAISRNNLKLADIADPQEFLGGDPLLRLDRRLASLLDGVYRPSEFYLRLLQRVTSLKFGTGLGRWITNYLTLPFGGAWFLLAGLDLLVAPYLGKAGLPISFYPLETFIPLGVFFLGLMHVPSVRLACRRVGRAIRKGFRAVFFDMPAWVMRIPILRAVVQSWPFQLFYWYLLKPVLVSLVVWATVPQTRADVTRLIVSFLAVDLLVNSRPGQAVSELFVGACVQLYDWLRADFLQGLIRWTLRVFKQISDAFETVLYTVDEWLRFRSGESKVSMVFRAVLGVLWFPIGYLARLYFVTLVEPSTNPLKLPISMLITKFMLFMEWYNQFLIPDPEGGLPRGQAALMSYLEPHLGWGVAVTITFGLLLPTMWLLPSAGAFFVWEMQSNWRLFRANRSKRLKPVMIGHHGETLAQLLRPGFHSGTLPKLYANLRRAERNAYKTGEWRAARTYRLGLHEVETDLQRFVERELFQLLYESDADHALLLSVGAITLACNRITIDLKHADFPDQPLRLAFEEQAGWLLAGVAEIGWLARVSSEHAGILAVAIAGVYHLSGVGLVREQVQAALPVATALYDIEEDGLVVWVDQRFGHKVVYDLGDLDDQLQPHAVNGDPQAPRPPLDAQRLIFARQPLSWNRWVDTWQSAASAARRIAMIPESEKLLPYTPSVS